jgi:nitrate/TMAO reductase-like tetraheme cytochrome c subunit
VTPSVLIRIALAFVVFILIGAGLAWEPVSRTYVATDSVCAWCHVEREYNHDVRMSFTRVHPPIERQEKGVPDNLKDRIPARCVDCHLPEGFVNTVYLYTHLVSITDLFGHFRDREGERSGDWIPLSAARAYRVRDKLLEHDSATCRSCHIESEIVPESMRGKNAHKDALANHETCIECHANLVHRFVEVQETEVAAEETEGEDAEGVNEFDEFAEPDNGGEAEEAPVVEESGEEVL